MVSSRRHSQGQPNHSKSGTRRSQNNGRPALRAARPSRKVKPGQTLTNRFGPGMTTNNTIMIDLLMLSMVFLHDEFDRREGAEGSQTESNQIKPAGRRFWPSFNVSVARSQTANLPVQPCQTGLTQVFTTNHTILSDLLMLMSMGRIEALMRGQSR